MLKIAFTSRLKDNQYFFINQTYYQFLHTDFIIEPILPRIDHDYQDIVDRNDALFICGGDDVHPFYFYQDIHEKTIIEKEMIETMDFSLIQAFYHSHKPIIGVCRGIQVLNVFFNGTLFQDIPHHDQKHPIHILKHSFLSDYFPQNIEVNSYHHQSINNVPSLFHISAISQDETIEAIENDCVLAVQWHPEKMNENHQIQFKKAIIKFIKKNNK